MKLNVKATTHDYEVSIGEGLRFRLEEFLPKTYSSILIVTDDKIESLYLQDLIDHLKHDRVFTFTIKSGEASKSFDSYYQLQTTALENGLDRQSLIIALGGGVVGDLAGFVAATYMRGIDYIQVPTTILSHDSSVGGKVAINHPLGKNMIGSFHAPVAVVYDIEMLDSLPEAEVRSGYAELMKEAIIGNEAFYKDLLNTNIKTVTQAKLKQHLYEGIKVKAQIVEEDEKESHLRKLLNLGHTLGHAIEASLGYGKMTHGEAIAIGMLFAYKLSERLYNISLPYGDLFRWLERNNYPLQVQLDCERLIEYMKTDKKSQLGQVQMVLLKDITHLTIENIDETILNEVLNEFIEEVRVK